MANTTWSTTDKTATVTLSGGNLIATSPASGCGIRAIDKQITGKFYWECTLTTYSSGSTVGIYSQGYPISASPLGTTVGACAITSGGGGSVYVDGVQQSLSGLGTLASGVTVCIAFDSDTQLIWFRVGAAGNWNGNAGYVPGVSGGVASRLGRAIPAYPSASFSGAGTVTTANFGDTAFVGTVPAGFTSGFTAGASVPTNALATQAALEQWGSANPPAQVTQVALEHWASVANAVFVPSTDTRAMILA